MILNSNSNRKHRPLNEPCHWLSPMFPSKTRRFQHDVSLPPDLLPKYKVHALAAKTRACSDSLPMFAKSLAPVRAYPGSFPRWGAIPGVCACGCPPVLSTFHILRLRRLPWKHAIPRERCSKLNECATPPRLVV